MYVTFELKCSSLALAVVRGDCLYFRDFNVPFHTVQTHMAWAESPLLLAQHGTAALEARPVRKLPDLCAARCAIAYYSWMGTIVGAFSIYSFALLSSIVMPKYLLLDIIPFEFAWFGWGLHCQFHHHVSLAWPVSTTLLCAVLIVLVAVLGGDKSPTDYWEDMRRVFSLSVCTYGFVLRLAIFAAFQLTQHWRPFRWVADGVLCLECCRCASNFCCFAKHGIVSRDSSHRKRKFLNVLRIYEALSILLRDGHLDPDKLSPDWIAKKTRNFTQEDAEDFQLRGLLDLVQDFQNDPQNGSETWPDFFVHLATIHIHQSPARNPAIQPERGVATDGRRFNCAKQLMGWLLEGKLSWGQRLCLIIMI